MATNFYFSQKVRSEQNLYEDIVLESIKMYGQDVYYLPRDIVNENKVFGEDVPSSFNSSYKVEMYIDNIEGFDGEGDLFTRFGVEIRDEATFIVSRRRWSQTVSRYDNNISGDRPREGDLIYLPLSNSMFEITHVEHEQPFYQLSNLPVFRCRAHLFEYNDEDFDTGVDTIQDIEERYAYQYALKLDSSSYFTVPGNLVAQTLPDGAVMSGEVMKYSDSDDLLFVGHVGSSDGLYRNFVTSDSASLKIRISGNGRNDSDLTILSVTDSDNKISENEQNAFFSEYIDDFLDFSESNPFGDPENN
tara:strand:+ start:961 stop:1869 length:909 start_codon:yes stop_codon:yes gene_type:complete